MASTTDAAVVSPARRVAGRTRVPGDKSISHRYAMLAALADGIIHHHRLLARRRLCRHAGLRARARRTAYARRAITAFEIEGRGLRGLQPRRRPARRRQLRHDHAADVRASSPRTAMRTTMIGDASLSKRPMRRVIEPLTRMGARIESRRRASAAHDPRRRPARRSTARPGRPERAGQERRHPRRPADARAAPSVTEPAPTRDHTERALAAFGAHGGRRRACASSIDGGQRLTAPRVTVPGRHLERDVLDGARRRHARRAPSRSRASA